MRVGKKYNYQDLDELIVEHVKAMARKVEELMQHEKFQEGSKADLDDSLHFDGSRGLMLESVAGFPRSSVVAHDYYGPWEDIASSNLHDP